MGDTNGNDDTTAPAATDASVGASAPVSVPAAVTLLEEVKDIINKSGPDVRVRVVSALAEKVIVERVELTKKGLDKYNEARGNFRKVNKPDNVFQDATGKKVELMSTAKVEEVKKAKEALERIEKALEKAFVDNDFTKLQEACK